MCFGSTLSYPHKEFLNLCPPRPAPAACTTRTRLAASSTRMQSSAGSRPANGGTRNPRRILVCVSLMVNLEENFRYLFITV